MEPIEFETLTDRSPVAIFMFNLTAKALLYVNPAFLLLTGIKETKPSLDQLKAVIHPDDYDYAKKTLLHLKEGTLTDRIELRIAVKEEIKWIRLMASCSEGDGSDILVYGNAIDVTAELENQRSFEKFANKKDAILNILAHDLTGPLGVINMLSSSLRSSSRSAAEMEQIDNIIKINKQATDLIRDFTSREFLETKDVVLTKRRINISRKLKEYVEEYQKSDTEIKRTFNFDTSDADVFLNVDESKFFQILNNLTTNALKFTRDNGVITIKIAAKDDLVLFTVQDDGIGIPDKYMNVLFEEFTPARRKGLQGEPTIGLGMFVIKKIVEWHNGRIWVDSIENEGTTVYFEIPDE